MKATKERRTRRGLRGTGDADSQQKSAPEMSENELNQIVASCEQLESRAARDQLAMLLDVTRHKSQRTVVSIRNQPVAGIIPIIDLAIIEEINSGISADNIVELRKYRSNISTTAVVDLTKRYQTVASDEARKHLSWLFKEAKYNLKRTIISVNGKVAAAIVPLSDLADLDRRERQLTERQKELLTSIKGASPDQLLSVPADAQKRKRKASVRLLKDPSAG
jgi:PHD/YefM family antitoxin component YafN of YafNO toxin-antitoxin module